jgi:hypothetical protein
MRVSGGTAGHTVAMSGSASEEEGVARFNERVAHRSEQVLQRLASQNKSLTSLSL